MDWKEKLYNAILIAFGIWVMWFQIIHLPTLDAIRQSLVY